MQKAALYECQSCGSRYPKWKGQCEACGEWNTLIETQEIKENKLKNSYNKDTKSQTLADVEHEDILYYKTGITELDNVLGKGLVKGSMVLLGGEPGIGKSTLSLQVCQECAQQGLTVLYISSEESESQIKSRALRLDNEIPENVWVFSQTNMMAIMKECERINPDIILLDSIQVVNHPELTSLEGTVSQVRYCATTLINWVKTYNKSAIMIGHITKDGQIAGPKVLEHLVDTILYLEGDRHFNNRILRCHKNRYGSTDHIGLFEMKEKGLKAIKDPSQAFIETSQDSTPGSVIVPYSQGNRIILLEIQALVIESGYGMAKRNFVGINPNRANLLIAALDKLCHLKLSAHDIFLTVLGGFSITDPSADLAIAVAIISSLKQQVVTNRIGICGEVGLTGEIRPISHVDKRIIELNKCGFKGVIVPKKNIITTSDKSTMNVIQVSYINDVLEHSFKRLSKIHA
ncbi:DNA repair protein RadA [bacterium]|nr:DNA repair protein RadA [bacterium]